VDHLRRISEIRSLVMKGDPTFYRSELELELELELQSTLV